MLLELKNWMSPIVKHALKVTIHACKWCKVCAILITQHLLTTWVDMRRQLHVKVIANLIYRWHINQKLIRRLEWDMNLLFWLVNMWSSMMWSLHFYSSTEQLRMVSSVLSEQDQSSQTYLSQVWIYSFQSTPKVKFLVNLRLTHTTAILLRPVTNTVHCD